jgi:hypothetical protein
MGSIPYKELLSTLAIALTFAAFIPYIRAIINGSTRPHVFSWVIWGSTTFVVFLAQIKGKGGVGAWPIGISGVITILIAFLACVKRSDITITKTDWVLFVSAMSSLPIWYLTSDPVWAVVVLTAVDLVGFGPTLRKVYSFPYSESLMFYGLFAARNLMVIMALEHYSVTTVLFPAVIAVACLLLISMASLRRRELAM